MFGDIGKMMKVARDMKEKMPAMRAELDAREFVAEAGGGAVRASVNGRLQVVDVSIAPEAAGDAEMLGDLVKAAVAGAQQKAAEAVAAMMEELTGGMDLPGLDGLLG